MEPTKDSRHVARLVDLIVTRYQEIEGTLPLLSRELSPLERRGLKVVASAGRITIGQVGARLGTPPSTTTWVVKELTGRGIFKRTRDDQDRRRTFVELAEKGEALARLMERIPDRIAADLLYKIDPERRDQFVALVDGALGRIDAAAGFK